MPKAKAPLPRKFGGRREDPSLLPRACRAFVDNYANLLRLGLIVGGLYLVSALPERMQLAPPPMAESRPAPEIPALESNPVEQENPVLSEGVLRALNCTKRDYQRENYSDCDLADSEVYSQDEIFKDDGSRTILDVETLYADAR